MQTWPQVLTRVQGGCVVHRCQNKNPIESLTSGCEWRHAPEACARRILGILKKSVSWVEFLAREKTVGFRLLAEALGGCHTRWWGCRWKSQNRKNVYLSPYVEEPLNSKVRKSFVLELRSRKCFSCVRDSDVLCDICSIRFAYRYEYVHFTYSYVTLLCITNNSIKHQ